MRHDEITGALLTVIEILETDQFTFGPPTTDYDILMRACYGNLLTVNQHTRRREPVAKRLRPEGAVQRARALTATVVELLDGEHGATITDVQTALAKHTANTP